MSIDHRTQRLLSFPRKNTFTHTHNSSEDFKVEVGRNLPPTTHRKQQFHFILQCFFPGRRYACPPLPAPLLRQVVAQRNSLFSVSFPLTLPHSQPGTHTNSSWSLAQVSLHHFISSSPSGSGGLFKVFITNKCHSSPAWNPG